MLSEDSYLKEAWRLLEFGGGILLAVGGLIFAIFILADLTHHFTPEEREACEERCTIRKSKLINSECHCKVPGGWMEPGEFKHGD